MPNVLMFIAAKTKKEEKSLYGKDMAERTKNGKSSTLTKLIRLQPREKTRNSDSMLTDHSTSDPDFQ